MYTMVSRKPHRLKRIFKTLNLAVDINILIMENHAQNVIRSNWIFAQRHEASRFIHKYAYFFYSSHFLKTKARRWVSPKAGNFPACR